MTDAADASAPPTTTHAGESGDPTDQATAPQPVVLALSPRLAQAAQWLARELEGATSAPSQSRVTNATGAGANGRNAQVTRARRTAENLAALLSLHSGAAPLCPMPLDLGDLVMTVLPAWKPRAPQHSFELALLGDIPPIVADGERVGQAIDRLLAAVVRATPAGTTVRVSVRPGQASREEVVLSIRHSEVAPPRSTPARHEPDPFADYFDDPEAGDERWRTAPNAALDLSLAREVVAAHGGRLEVEGANQVSRRGLAIVTIWPLVPCLGALAEPIRESVDGGADAVSPGRVSSAVVEREQLGILVVEAEPRMARFLRANLESCGYHALVAQDVASARRLADLEAPDLILLDGGLAGDEQLETLRRLIADGGCPVVILARKSDPLACARALDLGADDWLARPFNAAELLARVRASLRRRAANTLADTVGPITVGELTVDLAQRLVSVAGNPIALSKTEYKLLSVLARAQGAVLAHDTLLERVWGPGYGDAVEFVWVYIRRLRRKLEPDPACPRYILTAPGLGYRMAQS